VFLINILASTSHILASTAHILKDTAYILEDTTYILVDTSYILEDTAYILEDTAYILEDTACILASTTRILTSTTHILASMNPHDLVPEITKIIGIAGHIAQRNGVSSHRDIGLGGIGFHDAGDIIIIPEGDPAIVRVNRYSIIWDT